MKKIKKFNKKKRKSAARKLKNLPKTDLGTDDTPKTFVVQHGAINPNAKILISDLKRLMMPNTAPKLLAFKKNKVKDFANAAASMKVSHMQIISQSDFGLTLKMARLPHGPTLSFLIEEYTLMKDVLSNQKKSLLTNTVFQHPPCLMTNLQPDEGSNELQLCSKIFLDMFPTITPSEVETRNIKRCCLINYDEKEETLELRHYSIRTKPTGLSKSTKKLISNKIPNLEKYKEISDFITKSEMLSDSEADENPEEFISIQKKRKVGVTTQQSVIKLSEIGPRLTLKLMKIEDGLCEGRVLYHSYLEKSPIEILSIEKKLREQNKLKEGRRKEQLKNIKQKEEEKEVHKKKCLKGMTETLEHFEDDDREYFKDEVGIEADEYTFASNKRNSSKKSSYEAPWKKKKENKD